MWRTSSLEMATNPALTVSDTMVVEAEQPLPAGNQPAAITATSDLTASLFDGDAMVSAAIHDFLDSVQEYGKLTNVTFIRMRHKLWNSYSMAELKLHDEEYSAYISRKIAYFANKLQRRKPIKNEKVLQNLAKFFSLGDKNIRRHFMDSHGNSKTQPSACSKMPSTNGITPPSEPSASGCSPNQLSSSQLSKSDPPKSRRLTPIRLSSAGESKNSSADNTVHNHVEHEFTPTETPNNIDPARVRRCELGIQKVIKRIQALDNRDCNWDDEENSTYICKDRLVRKLMEFYEKFCNECGFHPILTGRPMQEKFKFLEVTRFPEIDVAVQSYVNKFCRISSKTRKDVTYASPEFSDIRTVVSNEVKRLNLATLPGEVDTLAKELFQATVRMFKIRRKRDLLVALPSLDDAVIDPAEEDESLRQRLEENFTKRRKEEDVLQEFVKKQEVILEQDGVEVESDSDDDAESDDVESDDNESDENESDGDEDEELEQQQQKDDIDNCDKHEKTVLDTPMSLPVQSLNILLPPNSPVSTPASQSVQTTHCDKDADSDVIILTDDEAEIPIRKKPKVEHSVEESVELSLETNTEEEEMELLSLSPVKLHTTIATRDAQPSTSKCSVRVHTQRRKFRSRKNGFDHRIVPCQKVKTPILEMYKTSPVEVITISSSDEDD